MRITLINRTEPAIELLIFTKNTRLTMSPAGLEEIKGWPDERKMKELEYMANTIPSSHEFVTYVFMIEEVSIACARQIMRSRHASYAQQSLRVTDVSSGWGYTKGPTITGDVEEHYDEMMRECADDYKYLIKMGASIEDARGILPLNMHTNFVMKIDMRNFIDLVHKRTSPRVQGEYRNVLKAMQNEVMAVHPWMHLFLRRTFDQAAVDLDNKIMDFDPISMVISNVEGGDVRIDQGKLSQFKTDLIKLVDQLRAKQ